MLTVNAEIFKVTDTEGGGTEVAVVKNICSGLTAGSNLKTAQLTGDAIGSNHVQFTGNGSDILSITLAQGYDYVITLYAGSSSSSAASPLLFTADRLQI